MYVIVCVVGVNMMYAVVKNWSRNVDLWCVYNELLQREKSVCVDDN